MLILQRKLDQTFTIGDDITITVTHIQAGSVRIGIDAPAKLIIRRPDMKKTEPPAEPKT